MTTQNKNLFIDLWKKLYGEEDLSLLSGFIEELEILKSTANFPSLPPDWYKDVVVYSLYVDLFNNDFSGLEERLDYLLNLGVSCLWLLPILDSPMRDAGFDIRNYRKIRDELLPVENQEEGFKKFLEKAHQKGIRVIFDIALNHTSDEHPWFIESKSSKENKYRNFYIWSADNTKYDKARIIFKGIEENNWKKEGDEYFFHRFFDFQPDLNYRNPEVLMEMTKNMLYWLEIGVDGFRADAIPYLWKEEGTDCENLENTHNIVKFIRGVFDYVKPGTLLLAEACQKPVEVVRYFGDGDECNAGYHFPLMPMIFKSIANRSNEPIITILDPSITPPTPLNTQWLIFLRCHDELSLELVYVSEEDRAFIHKSYCKEESWNFREGQGISARLAELMGKDPRKIGLAFSLMFSLPGTPVIYYGDEFGKLNDEQYYKEQIKATGKDDSRFLVRGRIDWEAIKAALNNSTSLESKVLSRVVNMLEMRNSYKCFGRGSIEWLELPVSPKEYSKSVVAFERKFKYEKVIVVHNLSDINLTITMPGGDKTAMEPFGYKWIVPTEG